MKFRAFMPVAVLLFAIIGYSPPAKAERILVKQQFDTAISLDLWLINDIYNAADLGPLVRGFGTHDIFKWRVIDLPDSINVDDALSVYRDHPGVAHAERDVEIGIAAVPDDPFFASSGSWGQGYKDLWGIHRVNLQGPWDEETGDPNLVIAGIDTGVDRSHPDLAENMWINEGEIPGNGVDDDSNGYVDDVHGWNFVSNSNNPMDDHGHGTHTVGTIAAAGDNGEGVTGVVWSAKIMALKFLSASGSGTLSGGINAIKYAADNGAKISNNSWGGGGWQRSLADVVDYAHSKGMVTVASAGNSNRDALDFTPANAPSAVTVAAMDPNDSKAGFSNWGAKLDVTAPGVDILSLKSAVSPMCNADRTVGGKYCRVSGTSMSGPHIAGLAALLWSYRPDLTNEEVRQILRHGSDNLSPAARDRDHGYGLSNAAKMFAIADSGPLTPVITKPYTKEAFSGASMDMLGEIGGEDFVKFYVEAAPGRTSSGWVRLYESTTRPAGEKIATLDLTKLATGTWNFKLTAVDSENVTYDAQMFDIALTVPDEPPPPPSDTEPPTVPQDFSGEAPEPTRVVLRWSESTDNVGVYGYDIYRNGALLDTVSEDFRMYTDLTVSGSTTYVYNVRAFDEAGNKSALSPPITVTTPEPEPPPAGPPPPVFVRAYFFAGHGAIIVWNWVREAHSYLVFRDGDLVGSTDNYQPFFFDEDAPASGKATYVIVSVDENGVPGPPSDPAETTKEYSATYCPNL